MSLKGMTENLNNTIEIPCTEPNGESVPILVNPETLASIRRRIGNITILGGSVTVETQEGIMDLYAGKGSGGRATLRVPLDYDTFLKATKRWHPEADAPVFAAFLSATATSVA
jgi:hypothetical protein